MKVGVLQVFISTAASFGVGPILYNFTEKAFATARYLATASFSNSSTTDNENK